MSCKGLKERARKDCEMKLSIFLPSQTKSITLLRAVGTAFSKSYIKACVVCKVQIGA